MHWQTTLKACLISCALFAASPSGASDFPCPQGPQSGGATADSAAACASLASALTEPGMDPPGPVGSYFYWYRSETATQDPRISERLQLTNGTRARSIGLIIGISSYKHLDQLPAVDNDVKNLGDFLKVDQKFDEVIVLYNSAATRRNINYFLDTYLRERTSHFKQKVRILIAFSGHGRPSFNGNSPSLLLADASSDMTQDDEQNAYTLSAMNTFVTDLSSSSFHVLLLINACYGGSIFGTGQGGQDNQSFRRGSWALTAGAKHSLVWSRGEPTDGSVFFDKIVLGLTRRDPDTNNLSPTPSYSTKGALPVVTLADLNSYLFHQIQYINSKKKSRGQKLPTMIRGRAPQCRLIQMQRVHSFSFFQIRRHDQDDQMRVQRMRWRQAGGQVLAALSTPGSPRRRR